jgi:hypothetical protein
MDNFSAREIAAPDTRPMMRMARIARERAARLERVLLAIDEGRLLAEIAAGEDLTEDTLRRFIRACGVPAAVERSGDFTLKVIGRRTMLPALDRLAAKWRCSRSAAVLRILKGAILDDGRIAMLADARRRRRP